MLDKLKNFAQTVSAVAAVLVLSWGIVAKAGWVVSRAEAQTMIDLAVQSQAAQQAQAVFDEAKARERADLTFQKSLLVEKIAQLMDREDELSGAEQYELEEMKADVARINDRLDALQ